MKVKEECLSIDANRVFVDYEDGIIKTATPGFFRRYKTHIWVAKLTKPLLAIPKQGQRLRMTLFHRAIPIKVEIKEGRAWKLIYESNEVPTCRAGYHQ